MKHCATFPLTILACLEPINPDGIKTDQILRETVDTPQSASDTEKPRDSLQAN